MLSKIKIDVDHDNQPIIRIEFQNSDDVRDKLVQKFLETFGGDGLWANFSYRDNPYPDSSINQPIHTAIIRPIPPASLPDQLDLFQKEAIRQIEMRPVRVPID